jgi:hypothetical protein
MLDHDVFMQEWEKLCQNFGRVVSVRQAEFVYNLISSWSEGKLRRTSRKIMSEEQFPRNLTLAFGVGTGTGDGTAFRAKCQFCERPWSVHVERPLHVPDQAPLSGHWYVCSEHTEAPGQDAQVPPRYTYTARKVRVT